MVAAAAWPEAGGDRALEGMGRRWRVGGKC